MKGKRQKKTKRAVQHGVPVERVVEVQEGYIVVDISMAAGGVKYTRTYLTEHKINEGRGLKSDMHTTKRVDNVEAVQAIDALVKEADYACRKHCAWTIFGWFTTEKGLSALSEEFDALRDKAVTLNTLAARAGSERRADIDYVPSKIDVVNEATARAVAKTIRETLQAIYDALRASDTTGPKNALHAPLIRAKNLDKLAVGMGGEAVKAALERIPVAKKEILDRLKNGESPESAGRAVDLGPIENAIGWFEEGGLSGIGDDRGARAVASAQAMGT